MTETEEEFSEEDMEAFKEMGNIGAGHAAIALTELFKREVDMSVPFLKIGSQEEIMKEVKLDNRDLIGYEIVEVVDPVRYRLSVIFKPEIIIQVLKLLSSTTRENITSEDDLSEMQKSLIKEIGSTIMLRYIAALNKMMKIDSLPEIAPEFKMGTPKDAFGNIGYLEKGDDKLLFIQLDLFTAESKFECHMFIQPHKDSLNSFREALYR